MSGATAALSTIATVASAVQGAQSIIGAVGGGSRPRAAAAPTAAQAPAFNPTRPEAVARPSSLGEYANFTPEQERSALATRGNNQGLGRDEDSYYRNLVQRSLIGDNNKPAADTNSLLPAESQYFSQQGMNTSGIMDFLKQLQGGA